MHDRKLLKIKSGRECVAITTTVPFDSNPKPAGANQSLRQVF